MNATMQTVPKDTPNTVKTSIKMANVDLLLMAYLHLELSNGQRKLK